MNIYANNGDKVVCSTYKAGYDSDKKRAEEYLEIGKIYTIDYTEVDSWSTTVYLQEFPLIPFNSVFFKDYKPSQPAAITMAEYLKNPSTCIYCGSEEITGGDFEPETFHVYRDVQCRTCDKVWTETFELTNITLEVNHQQLIERSHRQAVEKGFWEKPLTFDMAMALIISEIAEALEAYRKGRINPDWNKPEEIKESWECEIADAIIRIFDWCGSKGYELEEYSSNVNWSKENEGYNFMYLFKSISACNDRENSFEIALNLLLSYSKHHNIEVEKYIIWKLDYNLNRPFKHGKQF